MGIPTRRFIASIDARNFLASTAELRGQALAPSLQPAPRLIYPNGFRRVNRFAFVIHPLSQEYFRNIKSVELLSHVSPPVFMNVLEKAMAYAPPFVYSKVTGIKSPTGVETEGWLISVGGTPREIMAHRPEFTYRRLLDAARVARSLGAQIMGLGAFTKVVGDAGLTVARRAPLPITTGNSYSASGALWAAHDAMLSLALVPVDRGQKVRFKAMVVGATGAIGSVCARLLAMVAEEVAKRPDVLVIESGEIELPGNVSMKNIGLPPNVVYACLAETIVLALEGRFENFTVGRSIEWEKVREIYRLGIKHGMTLAAISGVNGPFSDADIRGVRKLALAARAKAPAPRQVRRTSRKVPRRSKR